MISLTTPSKKINVRVSGDLAARLTERADKDFAGNQSAAIKAALTQYLEVSELPGSLSGTSAEQLMSDFKDILNAAGYK